MYILIPIVFIVSVLLIIIKERKEIKVFLKDLLKSFICFIIILIFFLLEGLLIYLINSNAASANQVFLGLTALSGFFLFLFLQRIFKIKKWSRFRLIIDALLMIVLMVAVTGCQNNHAIEFKNDYESLNGKENKNGKIHRTITIDEKNKFEEITVSELLEKIERRSRRTQFS